MFSALFKYKRAFSIFLVAKQDFAINYVTDKSGVSFQTILRWQKSSIPNLYNFRAVLQSIGYDLEIKNFEVEVGPLKYISALIYGDDALNFLDSAVRIVILILVLSLIHI